MQESQLSGPKRSINRYETNQQLYIFGLRTKLYEMRHRALYPALMLTAFLLSLTVFFGSDVLSVGTKSTSTGPRVIVPNGGETWKVGSTYTIKWDKGTVTGSVKIEILKLNKRYATVIQQTANTGAYKWKIPNSIANGSEYKIKISNSAGADFSNKKFTVTGGTGGGGTQSIDQWGKAHYDKSGRAEGRTLPANGNYGDYVRKYPDLLAGFNATQGGGGSGGSGGSSQCSSNTSGGGCYGDYVRKYSDLLGVYKATGCSQKIENWGKSHYDRSGKREGRSLPASCGGSSGGGGSSRTCTSFAPQCWGTGYSSNPGMKVRLTSKTGSNCSAPREWAYLSCPYSIWYQESTYRWVGYYDKASWKNGKLCIGDSFTFSSKARKYRDNKCTITKVAPYN